ncbi:Secreted protein [Prescottella defluvii]|uniref:hypothetical protein n=1 Tax=Prescottella defluvii TaxID=1323361 RepID=UPI0004F36F46|nr:hypothetical protein [Prescottella defluvii]
MRSRSTSLVGRLAAGTAVAAAALLAAPALASAAPATFTGPTVTAAADGDAIAVSITNPNVDHPTSTCGAVAIDSAKVPEAADDPLKLLEPGFVAWTSGLDSVGAGVTKEYTTPALAGGMYAVVGACVSLTNPVPELGEPILVGVGDTFGSLGTITGSLGTFLPNIGDLIGGLLK